MKSSIHKPYSPPATSDLRKVITIYGLSEPQQGKKTSIITSFTEK